MANPAPPRIFDDAQLVAHRNRAADRFAEYDFLKARESSALVERLDDITHRFPRALDLGCHTGEAAATLAAHPKVDEVIAADPSPLMVEAARSRGLDARLIAPDRFDVGAEGFDLVTSLLYLHWVNDLPGALAQIRTLLKPDGLLLACLFGAGTLGELRTCLMEAETTVSGGASPRISPLPGLQDMAGLMQRAGFALPVVDTAPVTVRYDSALRLMQDVRGMGESAAFMRSDREPRRPLSRRLLMAASELYAERYSDPDGRVRATFNVIWLSGWAPSQNQPQPLRPGSGRVSLADAVRGGTAKPD